MERLSKFIENEFDRNAIFFAQTHSRVMASCDYIKLILCDNKIINLTDDERMYIERIRDCYLKIADMSEKIALEIQNYKEAYNEFLMSYDESYFD